MAASHVPDFDRSSFWERDPVLQRALRRSLGDEAFAQAEAGFAAVGAAAADRIDRLAAAADRERPTLRSHDPQGRRVDEVVYHPAYRELEALAYGDFRLVAVKYDPEARAAGIAHRVGFARTLLFGMGEPGVLCPVCMTDGVGYVLERHDPQLAKEIVPLLCWGRGDPRNTGAMFLTEKAGGSDVGAAETVARQVDGEWRLDGDKWFCSNVDAEHILALARPEGSPPGTRGLGLFLVERRRQSAESFRIERLKDKLGTRTMPTGEVQLRGAPARLVGELNAGFKQMADMLNLSRLYNSVVSCSAIGRSWLEARAYCERRVAFGRPVAELPLARETLSELEAEYAGALALVLEAVRAIDGAAGDPAAAALLRALTPLIKLFTAKVAVGCASEAVELLGGCGYIEDWPMSRVLRDAQVLPIWEGTTNVLSLDLLRVARKGGLEPLFARAQAALAASTQASLSEARERAAAQLEAAAAGLAAMAQGEAPVAARRVAFRLARGVQSALLCEAAEAEPEGPEGRAARRLSLKEGAPSL